MKEEMKDISARTPRVSPQSELLLALAARCEVGVPGWELDARIEQAIAPDKIVLFDAGSVGPERRDAVRGPLRDFPMDGWDGDWAWEAVAREVGSKRYTTSLDAAVTLLADGSEWQITNLYCIARAEADMNAHNGPSYGEHKGGHMALALCAAALRARAALAEQSREPMQSGEANPPPQGSAP